MAEPLRPIDGRIDALVRDLRPVRPLPPAGARALVWLAAAALIGLGLAALVDTADLRARLATPDLRLAAAGAVLTAVTAACGASLVGPAGVIVGVTQSTSLIVLMS